MSAFSRMLKSLFHPTPKTIRRQRTTRLGMEPLETREVPAVVTAQYDAVNHMLTVTGTEAADCVYVSEDGTGVVRVRTGATLSAAEIAAPIPIAGGTTPDGVNATELATNMKIVAGRPIVTNQYPVKVVGLGGNDSLKVDPSFQIKAKLVGGDGNDTLRGGNKADSLDGEAGNDLMYGKGGSDYLYGGDGDDTLKGGNGDGTPEPGNDTLYGGTGDDILDGWEGTTTCRPARATTHSTARPATTSSTRAAATTTCPPTSATTTSPATTAMTPSTAAMATTR